MQKCAIVLHGLNYLFVLFVKEQNLGEEEGASLAAFLKEYFLHVLYVQKIKVLVQIRI